ncbi:hypothetical protein DSO57_1002345 [Entomophthora muscae]|uniref:Uncharacterized protein n=1 Tax=Entomophthora muscae TaxID=34485 RepID=A0ACC2UUT9_9FUNG|nr:hypothetical protein DSO57_1002345 [Entomophthora muscae]
MRTQTLVPVRSLGVSCFNHFTQSCRPSFLTLNSNLYANPYNLNKKKITPLFCFHSRFHVSTPSNVHDTRPKDDKIQSLQVNLISETGEKQGIFPLSQVLSEMNRKDQVLIQVSEDEPPFCKIYSKKALYEKSKAEVKKKFKSTVSSKIFKFASNISPHDLQVKVNQCKKS